MSDLKILVFGDSNAKDYFKSNINVWKVDVERHDGLKFCDDLFDFLLTIALSEEKYDLIVLSIGTNDVAGAASDLPCEAERIKSSYDAKVHLFASDYHSGCRWIVVGPHSPHIDTNYLPKSNDNIHIDDAACKIIADKILSLYRS